MPRMARVVVPDYPHHVTQRGNRRQAVFLGDPDYRSYLSFLRHALLHSKTEVWAYCLMPNHVHLVMIPRREDGLREVLAVAHRKHAVQVNSREGWRGHLWQERYYSNVMDERHLLATVRYVERNPVRAGLCEVPEAWPWSSARAHLQGRDDAVVCVMPMLERIADWSGYLAGDEAQGLEEIRMHQRTGRPLGDDAFVDEVCRVTGRDVRKRKPGRKSRA